MKGAVTALTVHWELLDDAARADMFGVLQRNAGSLGDLIDQLLDFAHVGLDDGVNAASLVDASDVDLSEVVTLVVSDVKPALAPERITLDVVPGVRAYADPMTIRRILTNLLENAIKYAPSHTPITVEVRADGDGAVMAVEDEGYGIPPGERARVFERFYRSQSALSLRTRGLGIGLSLVRALVEALGGNVTVEDGPRAGGARFVVRLRGGDAAAG
jgi:two-component system OmpR family sensor kinase